MSSSQAAACKSSGGGGASVQYRELVGSAPPQRNWRGILIALLVILIVLSLIVVAVILVTPPDETLFVGEPFTFDEIMGPDFKPRHFSAKWVGEGNVFVYRSREGEIMQYDVERNATSLIMDNSTFRQLNTDLYFLSADLQYVLIAYEVEKVYRHSFVAKYQIYNRFAADPNRRLVRFPQDVSGEWRHRKLQFAGWADKGSALTFVYENDLFYQADPFTTPNKVTDTGMPKMIFNGIPDWLYEEEILHSNKAHWWSTEGTYLCYAQIDVTRVHKYKYPYYGDGTNIYGSFDEIAYPKAGDTGDEVNPVVKIYVVSAKDTTSVHKNIKPPREFENQEHYVTHVVWQDDVNVMVIWSNRAQNKSIITLCNAHSTDCFVNLIQTNNEGKGWIDIAPPLFIDDGLNYLTVLPERDGFHGFWKHLVMVTTPISREGKKLYITQGTWDVMEFSGYDPDTRSAYYLATNGDPRKRHLFRVTVPETPLTLHEPECLTCDFPEGCQYITANFSPNGKHYILNCLGPDVPEFMLKSTTDNKTIVMEDNYELKSRLKKKALPVVKYYDIEIEDGQFIWAKVLIPPTLRTEHITVYPMLVETYAGPGTQKVTEMFHLGWETYLASGENVIYVMIDGRGSSGRGERWLHATYRNLGTLEVKDQVAGGRFLRDTFSYVDRERIAIWGWSYGGFVTLHALGDESDVFRCGVAVAPVTDWRYYDTAYTERYMGLANSNDNYRGYDNANVSRKVENFRGKEVMLVHGTADDNVHFQHTAQFIKALTQADIDFRVQVYSDKDHGIGGPQTTQHLYRTMTKYLKQSCWGGGVLRELRGGKLIDQDIQAE